MVGNTIGGILARRTYLGYVKKVEVDVRCPELKIITNKVYNTAQAIRNRRRVLCPALKQKKAKIYFEGHFCWSYGAFMDDGVRYCGECGGKM